MGPNEQRSAALRARMRHDMEFTLQVAVKDAYNAIRERYEEATGDARRLDPDRLSRRLFELWRDGQRQLVRDIARVPYTGGRNGDLDAAVSELRSQRSSVSDDVQEKGWVDDLVGIVIDVAEDGEVFNDPQEEAQARENAARREANRVTSERMLWVMGAAVVLVVVAVLIYRSR